MENNMTQLRTERSQNKVMENLIMFLKRKSKAEERIVSET